MTHRPARLVAITKLAIEVLNDLRQSPDTWSPSERAFCDAITDSALVGLIECHHLARHEMNQLAPAVMAGAL